jgi:shikimate kinase
MNKKENIFLVGPMGAGKSTIGRKLAQSIKAEFIDSDREIESRTGVKIPLIFELEGETGFRKREKAMIDELSQRHPVVLATGGGAILDEENRRVLHERGNVVYLQTSVEQSLQRTHRDQNRPLLQTENPEQRLKELLETRDPLYQEIADLVVNTNGRTVPSVCNEILKKLGFRKEHSQRRHSRRKNPRNNRQ